MTLTLRSKIQRLKDSSFLDNLLNHEATNCNLLFKQHFGWKGHLKHKQTMLFNQNKALVHSDLCDVASLHSHTSPALCSLAMAQQFHLQETYRATFPPSQNWPYLYEEERDATR